MYAVRVQNRFPQAYRACKAAPTSYNTTREMALFPRLVANEFAPMFRLMDDYASHVATRGGFNSIVTNKIRTFNPRFDVRETGEAYELLGELPGIDQKDINIEFTDPQTLSIKGRTETVREEGTRPNTAAANATVGAQAEPATLPEAEEKAPSEAGESTASEHSSYHKPTVEDEANADDFVSVEAPTDTSNESTEAPKENAVAAPAPAPAAPQQPEQSEESSRYWVSERSVGTFQRSFAFPGRIDQENVKASLKDGILSIVVPKAAAPANRRIYIQ